MILQLLWNLRRLGFGRPPGAVARREPLEVCPPAPGRLSALRPFGVQAWLGARWFDSTSATPHRTRRQPEQPAAPLAQVRAAFTQALAGEAGPAAVGLAIRILRARSMRELWHLRTEVYTVVAQRHGEAEAQARLRQLSCHFSTRRARHRLLPF